MFAPTDAINALRAITPSARWAWRGLPSKPGELNRGMFALCEVYPKEVAERSYREPWGERGPVFGPKWDKDREVLIWVADFAPEDVYNLRFVPVVRGWWHEAMYDKMLKEAQEADALADRQTRELAGEMANYMFWRRNKTTWRPTVTPRKHLTRAERNLLKGDYHVAPSRSRTGNVETLFR